MFSGACKYWRETPNTKLAVPLRMFISLLSSPYQALLQRGAALEEHGITAVLSATKDAPQLPRCVKRKLCLRVSDEIGTTMDIDKAVSVAFVSCFCLSTLLHVTCIGPRSVYQS